MKVLANDGISLVGKTTLENAGFTVITEKINQADLISEINTQNIEVLLVRSATTARKELIDACPNLKLIGRGGVGMDNIDVAYAREKGLTVINTPNASSQSVAELVMGSLFGISRFFQDAYKNMGNTDFSVLKKSYAKGVELKGKTLLIIGFGRIGQQVANYALGCGMNVIVNDREIKAVNLKIEMGNGLSVSTAITPALDLDSVLPKADYVSIHVPKQADGKAVLSKSNFGKMKKGVRIVNAARGGVVNELDLLEALADDTIAAIALDVYDNEPTPNPALLQHAKIACTPHIGAATVEAQDRIGTELANAIITQFGGEN